MSLPTKEAIVFILDVSPSMNETSASTTEPKQTRLSCAKEALVLLLADLIIRRKDNEAGVILLKTRSTCHHLYNPELALNNCNNEAIQENVPFPHISELSEIRRPTSELLRKVRSVEVDFHEEESDSSHTDIRAGGFCDGIILAANAMYNRTYGKRFRRRIMLFTDAANEIHIDGEGMDKAVEGLRILQCPLTVIGLDFSRSVEFLSPVTTCNLSSNSDDFDELEKNGIKSTASHPDNKTAKEYNKENEDEDLLVHSVQEENEKLLISLTKWTSGKVLAASDLSQILKSTVGKRVPTSVLSKVMFCIAPGLSVPARISLLTSKATLPTLKNEVEKLDSDGQVMFDDMGNLMTSEICASTTYWDVDEPDIEVDQSQLTRGYMYGSNIIPIGPMDLEGLKLVTSSAELRILGYVPSSKLDWKVRMGPLRIISEEKGSIRSTLSLSSFSQALYRLEKAAICAFVSRRNADPIIGALVPQPHERSNRNHETKADDKNLESFHHLIFMRLPYARDIQNLALASLEGHVGSDDALSACEDLIDCFRLPLEVLSHCSLPNPNIRTFRKIVINKAIDPSEVNSTASHKVKNDLMTVFQENLTRAEDAIKHFRRCLPLMAIKDSNGTSTGTCGVKKKTFWNDIE